MLNLSVIVPVLDDDQRLKTLLQVLEGSVSEIIVVDGGKSEFVVEQCSLYGAKYLRQTASRGAQIAKGIEESKKPLLWVLHVDAYGLDEPLSRLKELAGSSEIIWGRFDVIMPELRWVPRMMNLRSRLTKICTGDQGMFFSASALNRVGGFPSLPLMEDVECSRRLKRCNGARYVACRERLGTSDRRWLSYGIGKTILKMWWYRVLYYLGESPDKLHLAYYQKEQVDGE